MVFPKPHFMVKKQDFFLFKTYSLRRRKSREKQDVNFF